MKNKKSDNLIYKFGSTFLRTMGVCLGAYIILCLINAYAPKKPTFKYEVKTPDESKPTGFGKKKATVQFVLEPTKEFETDL